MLVFQTGFILLILTRPTPQREFSIPVQPGTNYSLLIDSERLPIKAKYGEAIQIDVLASAKSHDALPKRIVINQMTSQDSNRAWPRFPNRVFRFYYNSPPELKKLYDRENLAATRAASEWGDDRECRKKSAR